MMRERIVRNYFQCFGLYMKFLPRTREAVCDREGECVHIAYVLCLGSYIFKS